MKVTLNDDEVQTFRGLLHDYLPELTLEVTRTDTPEIRRILVKRRTRCERLLGHLGGKERNG